MALDGEEALLSLDGEVFEDFLVNFLGETLAFATVAFPAPDFPCWAAGVLSLAIVLNG